MRVRHRGTLAIERRALTKNTRKALDDREVLCGAFLTLGCLKHVDLVDQCKAADVGAFTRVAWIPT
jgi:hypothetical protein